MGNPLYSDTVGEMCYNPAKSFQIADAEGAGAWYQGSTVTWDTGTKNPTYWKGKVVGIADYDNNPEGHPVSIKLETGTTNDYFLGFNRAYRANQDNEQADDQVTIILTGNNGVGYSQSFLQATLVQGDSFTISKWHGTSYNLIITVNVIDISVSPGYADVTLNFGNASVPQQADQPTSQPTSEPTNIPTNAPTHVPTKVPTDQIPPSAKPSGQPSKSPTRPPTLHPTAKARKLQMK